MASRFRNKVNAAAMKVWPDDAIELQVSHHPGGWKVCAVCGSLQIVKCEARGLVDVMQKVCKAVHDYAGTDLRAVARRLEKEARHEG